MNSPLTYLCKFSPRKQTDKVKMKDTEYPEYVHLRVIHVWRMKKTDQCSEMIEDLSKHVLQLKTFCRWFVLRHRVLTTVWIRASWASIPFEVCPLLTTRFKQLRGTRY